MQEIVINRGIALETRRDVLLDTVMPPEFIEQLGHEARDLADVLDGVLLAQTSQGLRWWRKNSI
jgi:hypothetical protein